MLPSPPRGEPDSNGEGNVVPAEGRGLYVHLTRGLYVPFDVQSHRGARRNGEGHVRRLVGRGDVLLGDGGMCPM